ncbi:synaptobrevin homolog YKT6 isoform 1-T1 [Morphnus guianensis]
MRPKSSCTTPWSRCWNEGRSWTTWSPNRRCLGHSPKPSTKLPESRIPAVKSCDADPRVSCSGPPGLRSPSDLTQDRKQKPGADSQAWAALRRPGTGRGLLGAAVLRDFWFFFHLEGMPRPASGWHPVGWGKCWRPAALTFPQGDLDHGAPGRAPTLAFTPVTLASASASRHCRPRRSRGERSWGSPLRCVGLLRGSWGGGLLCICVLRASLGGGRGVGREEEVLSSVGGCLLLGYHPLPPWVAFPSAGELEAVASVPGEGAGLRG